MCAFVDHANQKEHAGRGKSMIEHLQDCAIQGDMPVGRSGGQTGRGNTKYYEPHMIHGRVCDKSLEVRLSEGGKRTKDDCRDSKESQRACKSLRLIRIKRKYES